MYTAVSMPSGTDYYDWDLSYTADFSIIANTGRSANPMSISFDSRVTGAAYIRVNAVDTDQPFPPTILGTTYLTVYRSLPAPVTPNGGTVIFCGANETVAINSSPYVPFNTSDPSDVASCLFHCTYTWQAPGGWNFASGTNSPSNNVRLGGTQNDLQSPGSVSNGNNGFVVLTAMHSECSADVNSSSSAVLWVGAPTVSNGEANGTPANSPLYIPSGYANLSVNAVGGGSLNWYISNGSGSLYPNGTTASISFSGFVRVVAESSNRCGNGGSWTFYLNTENGGYGYRVGPNPAKEQVSVIPEMQEMMGELIQDVTLYDDKSKVRGNINKDQLNKDRASKKSSIDLNVKGLPRGTYFLHVKAGDQVQKHQILLD